MDHLQSLLSPTRAPPLATSDIHLATQSCSMLPVPTSFQTPDMEFGRKQLQSRSLTEAGPNLSASEDESGNKRQRYWQKFYRARSQSNFIQFQATTQSSEGVHKFQALVIWRLFLKAKSLLLLDLLYLLYHSCAMAAFWQIRKKHWLLIQCILQSFLFSSCLCSSSPFNWPKNSFRAGF